MGVRYFVILIWIYSIINFLILVREDLGLFKMALYMNLTVMIGVAIIIFLLDTKIIKDKEWIK